MTEELATTDSDELSRASDALASAFGDDFDFDDAGDYDADDIQISWRSLNKNGVDENDDPFPKNAYVDSVTKEATKSMKAVLVVSRKVHEFTTYDAGDTTVHCRSEDRKTGTMADGTRRACEGCPDAAWKTAEDGKRIAPACTKVHYVLAVDAETEDPFMMRFKRQAGKLFGRHQGRFHINKHKTADGRRCFLPLFAYTAILEAEIEKRDGGTYANPKLRVVRDDEGKPQRNDPALINLFARDFSQYRETLDVIIARSMGIDDSDSPSESSGVGASAADFSDDDIDDAELV